MSVVHLEDKLASFSEHWSPKIVASFNGHDVMVVKLKGEFVWHSHPDTDDFFYVANFLYDLGYPVAQNGVMIMIASYELMVKDACSGMNSIFVLPAIGVFYVHEFVPDDPVRRILLVLSTVPIAILANCFRVLALVLGAYYFGVDRIEGLFHDATGLALWLFALILFFLLDRVLVVVGYLIKNTLSRSGRARGAAA